MAISGGICEEAPRILKRCFGNEDTIKRNLYFELRRIPTCMAKVEELRGTVEALERIYRQLKTVGENLQQTTVILAVKENLPLSILIELGKTSLKRE